MVWRKAGTTTLGSAGDDLDITSMTTNTFNQFLVHIISSGDASIYTTFNNDTGSDYARRTCHNGGTDGTSTSDSSLDIGFGNADDKLYVHYWVDIAGEEKLGIAHACNRNTTGAGNAPKRVEQAMKFTDTSARITRIDQNNNLSGSYDTNSNITAIGSDGTEALNVQDGAIYYDTDLNKEYVLYNNTWTEV